MGVINNNKVISTTQNKKLKPSNFINICPLCWNIPTINILYDQPYKIHLHCNKCFHDETLPLIDFLEQLEKTKVEKAKRKNIKAKTRNVKSEMSFLPRYARMFCIDYESQNNNVPDEEEEKPQLMSERKEENEPQIILEPQIIEPEKPDIDDILPDIGDVPLPENNDEEEDFEPPPEKMMYINDENEEDDDYDENGLY